MLMMKPMFDYQLLHAQRIGYPIGYESTNMYVIVNEHSITDMMIVMVKIAKRETKQLIFRTFGCSVNG